jgi:hypothetical protein
MSAPLLFGPYGGAGNAAQLAQHGVNAIWFHGFSPAAFDFCGKRGLSPCVEFPTFRADFGKRPDLVPIGADGSPIRYGSLVQGVCLSKAGFLHEIEARILAGVRQYVGAQPIVQPIFSASEQWPALTER